MTMIDQCPTSKKNGLPADTGAASLQTAAGTGRTYWRSLDEVADTPEFRAFLQREFPSGASELLQGSRRTFLKIMGASVALAGAATLPGCRRPEHKIITYHDKPEDIVPGKPLFYATTRAIPGGGAEGLLVETLSGRPTKLEGNPMHPRNNGAISIEAQASVLALYDPDRTPHIVAEMSRDRARRGEGIAFDVEPWSDFSAALRQRLNETPGGEGVVFLVNKKSSPTRDRLRDRIARDMPGATWLAYEPLDNVNELEGTRSAFGAVRHLRHRFDRADVVVSLAHDFMGRDASIDGVRGWARNRIREGEGPRAARDTEMSRLYVAEPLMTLTGGQADHRMGLRVGEIAAIAVRIAERVLARTSSSAAGTLRSALAQAGDELALQSEHADAFARHAADDLIAARGRSALTVGPAMPASIHALAIAVNDALGNSGQTVLYRGPRGDSGVNSVESMRMLARMLDNGEVRTLIAVDTNPVFDIPADLNIADRLTDGPAVFHIGEPNETAERAAHHTGIAYELEAWGDAEDFDGTYGVTQPMIRPLHGFRSEIELLMFALGDDEPDGYSEVARTVARRSGLDEPGDNASRFNRAWRSTLHDGLSTDSVNSAAADSPGIDLETIAAALREDAGTLRPASASIDVVFLAAEHLEGGRNANNGWIQELPDTVTKCCWGNPALVGPETARSLGLRTGRKLVEPQYNHTEVARITLNGRSVDIPIWIQPGMPENTIVLRAGNGRRVCGRVGEDTGYDVYPLRTSDAMRFATGATVARAPDRSPELIANTQDHWSMEGRDIVREADLPAWRTFGDQIYYEWHKDDDGTWEKKFPNTPKKQALAILKTSYADKRELTFAGRFGMEAHSPELQSPYTDRQEHYYVEVERTENGRIKKDENKDPIVQRDGKGRPVGKRNPHGRRVQQWGMTIDMNTCTGCGACITACQAENNIPIVGKVEVAKGREMQWIRIDRYYGTERSEKYIGTGDPNASMMAMPVTCLHCENAPCEVVCPVNATVHGEEGTNNMAYNRCIGTRYCANNCPYKVRRFNLFDYATKQYEGGLGQAADALENTVIERNLPDNEKLIPPRLREKRIEVSNMQYNPHVTVRSRGVMEKCTFCIQRINEARVESKLHDLPIIPDGFFETACQQACPTDAIVFGDIYDYASNDGEGSKVHQSMKTQRAYGLLSYLNTKPRLIHLMRIRNPNPALLRDTGEAARIASWDQPFHGDTHSETKNGRHDGGDHAARIPTMRLPILNNQHQPEGAPA